MKNSDKEVCGTSLRPSQTSLPEDGIETHFGTNYIGLGILFENNNCRSGPEVYLKRILLLEPITFSDPVNFVFLLRFESES